MTATETTPQGTATFSTPAQRGRALILDGSPGDDPMGERMRRVLAPMLRDAGWEAEATVLRDQRIGACGGDFNCWVKHPGICMTDDDNRSIAATMMASDLVVYLTPVRFGGFASGLKRMADHQIPLIAPDFTTVQGETHHARRYGRYPSILGVGWQAVPDAAEAAVFRTLVLRNGLNFHSPVIGAGVVDAAIPDEALRTAAGGWLAAIARGERIRPAALPAQPTADPGPAPRRAVLLVGSPRLKKSSSHALGAHLAARLGEHGVAVETILVHPAARSASRMTALLDAVDAADLVVLAFPLYIDSLPAPMVEVLEKLAAHRAGRGPSAQVRRQRLAAIVNCGFPEASHNDPALAICATFARKAGFEWAGGLSLGGGQGLLHGAAPASMGRRARHVVEALDLAGAALAAGRPIPAVARTRMARLFVPAWLYRTMGRLGWRMRARQFGMARALSRRPYAP